METNKLNTESVLKFLGIVFFIGMVWFFVFTVFKTNNQYLGILMKEQEEKFNYKRESFKTMEGFSNLGAMGTELKTKINKINDEKKTNQEKSGISKSTSDDLKDDVSEYAKYEVDNLGAKAVIAFLDLDKKYSTDNARFKAVEKIMKQREIAAKVEKLFNGIKI